MTDREFTEAEIMKALEICSQNDTNKHYMMTYHGIPVHILFESILNLINRKNAEIEDLQNQLAIFEKLLEKAEAKMEASRAEAIKEFAEKVQAEFEHECVRSRIWQIAKEMGCGE